MAKYMKHKGTAMRDIMDIIESINGEKILWTTIVLVGIVWTVKEIQTSDWINP